MTTSPFGSIAFCFSFTKEEEEIMGKAINLGIDQNKVFKMALVAAAKKELALAEFDVSNMTDELLFDPEGHVADKSLKSVTGMGPERVKRTVKALMDLNNEATTFKRRFCVTRGLVFTLCGSNRASINAYFDENEKAIDSHNDKYGLLPSANRKGVGWNWHKELSALERRYGKEGVFSTMYRFKQSAKAA
jgi:hypothetical protein